MDENGRWYKHENVNICIGRFVLNTYWGTYEWDWGIENVGVTLRYSTFLTLWHPFGHANLLVRCRS